MTAPEGFSGFSRHVDASVRATISCGLGFRGLRGRGAFPRQDPARILAAAFRTLHKHGALQCVDVLVLGGAEPADPATAVDPRTQGAARQLADDPRGSAG